MVQSILRTPTSRALVQLIAVVFDVLQIVFHDFKDQRKPRGDNIKVSCDCDEKQFTIVLTGGMMT